VDAVRRFIVRSGNINAPASAPAVSTKACEQKEVSRSRNKENNATVVAYDTKCNGRIDANYIIPDNKSDAVMLTKDRNGDGREDVVYFDLKRQVKWDLSLWDENFSGHWTLVGYHPDGSITPTQFESYEVFQKRMASR
jgi:hypothetical protein